jgi:protein NDRG1
MAEVVQNFCIFHVNAPGMEEAAAVLPEDFEYPTMDELADQVLVIIFQQL